MPLFAQKKRKPNKNTGNCINPAISRSGKTTIYTYEYDYSDPNKNNDCAILPRHNKSEVYIRIKNINRILYDIDANGTSQNLPLQDIGFDSLIIKAISINGTPGTPVDAPEAFVPFLKNGVPEKGKTRPNLFLKQKNKIVERLSYINSNYLAWVQKMQSLELFLQFAKNVPVIIAGERFSQDNLKLKLITEPNVIQFDRTIITTPGLPNIATDYPMLQSSINTRPSKLAQGIKETYEKMVKANQEIDVLIAEIKAVCKTKLPGLQEEDCDTEPYTNGFPEDFDKALEEAKKIDVNKITEVAGDITVLLNSINDPANFFYQLNKPFEIEGDWYDAKVNIKPKPAYANIVPSDSFVYRFPVKGKFEWAIGAALNFHASASLLNQSFQIDSTRLIDGMAKKDTFTIKKNSNRNKMIPSIGMMAHFYWQQHSDITPGIVFGLSTSSVELKDLRAYLGVSCIVGGLTDKLFFNTGLALGWVDRLKANLEIGENPKSQIPFNGDNVGSPDQLVEKAFKVGWFFGFTYRLSK